MDLANSLFLFELNGVYFLDFNHQLLVVVCLYANQLPSIYLIELPFVTWYRSHDKDTPVKSSFKRAAMISIFGARRNGETRHSTATYRNNNILQFFPHSCKKKVCVCERDA